MGRYNLRWPLAIYLDGVNLFGGPIYQVKLSKMFVLIWLSSLELALSDIQKHGLIETSVLFTQDEIWIVFPTCSIHFIIFSNSVKVYGYNSCFLHLTKGDDVSDFLFAYLHDLENVALSNWDLLLKGLKERICLLREVCFESEEFAA